MKSPRIQIKPRMTLCNAASCLALIVTGISAHAAESSKLRQSPVGAFGGEMAASTDNPGFFGTAALSVTDIYKVVDANGNGITPPVPSSVPLQTGPATGGAVPSGTYSLSLPTGSIDFSQTQTQVNLLGGYLTESTYNGGRLAFAVNLPLIKQSRTVILSQPLGTVSPTPNAALPAALRGAIGAVANATNAQIQAQVAASARTPVVQNADVSGFGDTELSMLWIHHKDRLKVAAGVSLFVPTGMYDKARGPNPGFGDFYTLRPGVALTYSLNPNHTDAAWDAGVTVAGRVSFGINTSNKETNYRSGNFVYAETGLIKVINNWAFGANLLAIQQVTDDSGTGAPANGSRYKNYGAGPFLSYKIPGQDAGFNLQYSQSFGSRNALMSKTLQLRVIKAW